MSFHVHRLDHINVLTADLDASIALWRDLTGFEPLPTVTTEHLGLRNADFVLPDGNIVGLMTPIANTEMGNVIQAFIDKRGEGLYIIALAVDDPEAVASELAGDEIRTVPVDGMAFVHPKSANGVSVEFIDKDRNIRPLSNPAGDINTHRALRVDHVSLAVDDLDEAMARWGKILGGVEVRPAGHAPEAYRGALARLSNCGIGLAEPAVRDASNVVFRAMRHGEGFLSLALEMDDVQACADALNAQGWQVNVAAPGLAYVSARSTRGVMVELTEPGR